MSKLLSRPFCGGSPRVGQWATHYVKCTKCNVEVIGLTQAEAVVDWNTRVPPASPRQPQGAHADGGDQ